MNSRQWAVVKMFMTVITVYVMIRIILVDADKRSPKMFGIFERMLKNFQTAINEDTPENDKISFIN